MSPFLNSLLRPRSVAVIGATNRKESLGGKLTARLFAAGFTGPIFPVNPKQSAVHSTKSYAAVGDIPDVVDLAVVVVPRDAALATVRECCHKGVQAVILITAGFGEVDAEGRRLQEQLAELCRAHGVRLLGPNCMGVINTHAAVGLDATFTPTAALPGPIAFVSQSGALAVAVLNACQERAIGFSQFVSLGNKADVTENDLLDAWEDDPEAPVITVYLESFADPAGFLARARRITPKKPIILVKAGRTEVGARAASSHTGALAAADTGAAALCRQAGILRVDTIDDLLDAALVLSRCPLPAGRRVAVLTNAGGPAVLAADALARLGIDVPPLAAATRDQLRAALPREAAVANPVDMIASAGPEQYARCLRLLLEAAEVDAIITITVTPPLFSDPIETLRAMQPALREAAKPVLTVFLAGPEFYGRVHEISDLPAIFRLPESAARALAAAMEYAERRTAPPPLVRDLPADDQAIGALVERRISGGDGLLPPADAFRALELAGVPLAPWRVVGGLKDALAAARALGYPIVLKAVGDALVHKTELGAVALDLADPAALEQALEQMTRRLTAAGQPPGSWSWLVQPHCGGGREVIIGAHRDPQFGPLVMFGLGGKYVEILHDVCFAMTPTTRQDAENMVQSIRGLPLLTGVRGEAGVDLEPAIEAIERVARLVQRHPEIAELDLNPFLLHPSRDRSLAVDARIRVAR